MGTLATSISDEGHELEARLKENMATVSRQARRADREIQKFTRERPVVAVFAALTAGYLLGRLLSRF